MEYYTLKQYLLALREEYKKINEAMMQLNKDITFNKKKITNTKFRLTYNPKLVKVNDILYRYTILFELTRKQNILKNSINNILNYLSGIDLKDEKVYQYYYDIPEKELKLYNYSDDAGILVNDSFKKNTMKILNSNEIKSLSSNCCIDSIKNCDLFLDVNPICIKFFKKSDVLFNYYLYNDTITFNNNFTVNYDNINELFNTKISKKQIVDEQRQLIENNKSNEKEIIFIGNKSYNSFKFHEEDHKILMKTNTKNTTK